MPKSAKKRKTAHHYPSTNGGNNSTTPHILSHEEIWDDSALLRSWNDALAEYEFYHSIHAKGEDVEEVLKRAELEAQTRPSDEVGVNGEQLQGQVEIDQRMADDIVTTQRDKGAGSDGEDEGEIVEDDNTQVTTMKELQAEEGQPLLSSSAMLPADPGLEPATGRMEPGERMSGNTERVGSSAEQLLENIKMSYYWAGYYSGLYDAQRESTK